MYKKAWCTCKIVVLVIQPIALVEFPLPSPSSDVKVPNNSSSALSTFIWCLSVNIIARWDLGFFKLIFSCDGSEKHRMSSAQTQWYYVLLHMSLVRNVYMILIFNSSNFGLQIFIECLLPWNEKYQHSSVKFFVTFEACK